MNVRTTLPVAALVGLAFCVSARAQTRPAVFPTRDVTVDYHLDGTLTLPVHDFRVAAQARAERLRVEQPNGIALLIDRELRRVLMLLTAQNAILTLPWPKQAQQGLDQLAHARFMRQGSDAQAGYACTIYDVRAEDRHALACITADGVLLRADGLVRGKGENGSYHLAATAVRYAPLDPGMFEPPPGAKSFKLPSFAR